MAWLVFDRAHKREKVKIERDFVSIGRGKKNLVQVDDTRVSHEHCIIVKTKGKFMIRDLDSTNGTFVNNRKISGVEELKLKSVIRIGNTELTLEPEEEEKEPPGGKNSRPEKESNPPKELDIKSITREAQNYIDRLQKKE